MEFWRDQIANFVSEVVKEPVALVGNSIGSLAAVRWPAKRRSWRRTSV